MTSLRLQLEALLHAHAAVVGIGNPERGDDAAGVRVVERLLAEGCANVFVAGTEPERVVPSLACLGFARLLLVDAVDFGGDPGAVVWLNAQEMQSRFPQVSTHRLSLGTLARLIELERGARVWLLGIQPAQWSAPGLSPAVAATVNALGELLQQILKCSPREQPVLPRQQADHQTPLPRPAERADRESRPGP